MRTALFAIFALSGFAGLVYEAAWSHYLKLFLGHSAYAQTFVIAVFMGGMAVGAYLSARLSTRIGSLLRGYAYAELAIGLFALVFHGLFEFSMAVAHDSVLPALPDWAGGAFRQLLALVLLLPPCVLLGMTFPLMSGGVVRLYPETTGSSIANLYFTNSIGAAAGVLVTGFVLVEWAGLPGTMLLAGALNIVIGVVVLGIARSAPETPLPVEPEGARRSPRLLLGIAALTGLASFIYEIAWIRMLSMLLGSSNHAFELMLATFIAGLALGGLWIKRRIDRLADVERFLARIQWIMGLLALGTVFIYGACFDLMAGIVDGLARTSQGYVLFNLFSYGIAVLVMFPAAFCAGTTLPLITHALLRRGHGERSIGQVYASNTLGSILGVVCATHLALPLLGLKGAIILGAAVDVVAGLAIWLHAGARRTAVATGAVALVAWVLAVTTVTFDTAAMSSGVFRYGASDTSAVQVRFHQDGKAASVTVYDNHAGIRVVATNGKPDASVQMDPDKPRSGDEETQDLLAYIPLAVHPQAKTVGVVGFGSGMTTANLLGHPGLERVDTVEIEAAMVAAGEHFRPHNEAAFTDPRSNVVIDDARSYFSGGGRVYDVIVSEPSNPWVSGVSSLFSEEFYAHMAGQLAPDGVLAQWIHLYELEVALIGSIMQALSTSFPYYTVYALGYGDIIIAACKDAPVPAPSMAALSAERTRERLRQLGILNAEQLAQHRLGDQTALGPLWPTLGLPANSDYFPTLGNRAAEARFLRATARELARAGEWPIPVLDMLGAPPTPTSLDEYVPRAGQRGSFSPQIKGHHQAVIMARSILGLDTAGVSLPPAQAAMLNRLLESLADCELDMQPGEATRLLHGLAQVLGPRLAPDVQGQVWARVGTSACHGSRDGNYAAWHALYAAAGAHDVPALGAAAAALVEAGEMQPGRPGQILLSAGMLAALRSGEPGQAQALFTRHSVAVLGGEVPLLFQLLLAHTAPAR